jgi:hypothetical protein
MKKRYLLIFLLFLGANASAQQPSRGFPKSQYLGTVNFRQLIGGVVLLEAYFDTLSTPLNFILDTGSGGISLDSSTCDEFQIIPTPTDTFVSGIGGNKKVSFVFNRQLKINNLEVQNLNFHINDYTVLTGIYGVKIDGIMGYSVLNRYIVKVDYDNNKIDFFSPGEMDYPKKGYILTPDFTKLPIQKITVQDNRKIDYSFYFDTGAGLALLLSSKFDSDSSVISKKRKPVTTSVEGLLGKTAMQLTISKRMKMGPYTFKNVPTYLYNDEMGIIGYPRIGGLLGSEIFRRFNMIINYPKREIHILPNKNFDEEFDYSYTGMNLYFTDGKILVDDVIIGSPAEKAGLQVRDEIISVGNDISLSMESYRNTLRAPHSLLKIYVKRNKELFELYLKVGSIM